MEFYVCLLVFKNMKFICYFTAKNYEYRHVWYLIESYLMKDTIVLSFGAKNRIIRKYDSALGHLIGNQSRAIMRDQHNTISAYRSKNILCNKFFEIISCLPPETYSEGTGMKEMNLFHSLCAAHEFTRESTYRFCSLFEKRPPEG